jgi:iron complex outermembrane receptor protein
MTKHRRNSAIYAAASLAAAAWLPSGAYAAQPAGETVAGAIEEVLVTARRREESLQEVPIAISAFGGDDLVERGVESVQSMNAIAPNLSVMGGGATGESQGSFRIRGLPGVAVYIDGVWQASTDGLLTTSVVEVDRIEVLRGPQGTLFGSSSLGGAIQYVTRAPGDTFGARFQGSIGSYGRRDFQAAFDLPLHDTFKTKFTAASQFRDGFVDSVVIDRSFGDVNDELYRADFLWTPTESLSVRYNIEDTRTNRNGPARVLKNIGTASVLSGGTFSTYPQAQAYINAFGVYFNNQNNVSGYPGGVLGEYQTKIGWENPGLVIDVMRHTLDASWDVNDWLRLRSISGYRDTMRAVQTDFDGAQEVFMLERDFRAKSMQFTEELQILGTHEKFDWVLGGYYSKENNRGRTITWALPEFTCDLWSSSNANANGLRTSAAERAQCRANRAAALGVSAAGTGALPNGNLNGVTNTLFANAVNSNTDGMTYTEVESSAIFGDLTWRVTDKFTAAAGVRYSKEESTNYRIGASTTGIAGLSLQNRASTFPDGSYAGDFFGWQGGDLVAITPSREFSATTKRLTLQYQWTPDLMTYIGWADGFGPGGTSTVDPVLYGGYADIPVGTLVFDKQTVENLEIGLRADWFNGRVRTNISAFMTDWANQQTSTYIATRFAGPGALNPTGAITAANPATTIDRNGDGVNDLYIFPALRTTNINKAEAAGIEFEGTWSATDALRFNLNLGWLKTKYVDLGPAALGVIPAVTKNSSFAQAPEITGNVAASYVIGLANGTSLTPRLDYTYTDDYVLTTDDIRQSKQAGYGLLNARLAYDSGANWSVALAGTNLTNERYLNSGFITAAEQFDFVTLGRPREWGLTFNLRFE